MKFYTAGPWKDREFVKGVAQKLRDNGYEVNSRWLEVPETPPEGLTMDDYLKQQALDDMQDVISADCLIYINTGTLSEGKATELGVSIAMLKPIIAIGGRSGNIFLNLNIPNYPTIEEAIDFMKEAEYAEMLARHGQ